MHHLIGTVLQHSTQGTLEAQESREPRRRVLVLACVLQHEGLEQARHVEDGVHLRTGTAAQTAVGVKREIERVVTGINGFTGILPGLQLLFDELAQGGQFHGRQLLGHDLFFPVLD